MLSVNEREREREREGQAKKDNLPGKKPGTSSNVISGMLKQSQNRTNLAPLMEETISRQPTVT